MIHQVHALPPLVMLSPLMPPAQVNAMLATFHQITGSVMDTRRAICEWEPKVKSKVRKRWWMWKGNSASWWEGSAEACRWATVLKYA